MVEYIACQICTNATSSPYIPKTLAAPSRARADQLSFLQGSATSAVGRDMRGCVAADTAGAAGLPLTGRATGSALGLGRD